MPKKIENPSHISDRFIVGLMAAVMVLMFGVSASATYLILTKSQTPTTPQPRPTETDAIVKEYRSEKLGVAFNYLNTDQHRVTIAESDDRIYVGLNLSPDQDVKKFGQSVQKFTKEAGDTLAQAIEQQFLSDIDDQECFVEKIESNVFYPSTIETAAITFPFPENVDYPWFDNDICPADYRATNGIRYFWMDTEHPDSFYFFDIGQYAIMGADDNETDWAHTFRILNETVDMSDWQTYTNEVLGIQFRYPAEWGKVEYFFQDYGSDSTTPAAGKIFRITFSEIDSIYLGGVSQDFMASRGGSFTDFFGYQKINDKYYTLPWMAQIDNNDRRSKLLSPDGVKILNNLEFLIYQPAPPVYDGYDAKTLGAYLNLKGDTFKGLAIYKGETENVTDKEFYDFLSTFRFTEDMSDWQTYTSSKFGFQIDLPSDFKIIEFPETPSSITFGNNILYTNKTGDSMLPIDQYLYFGQAPTRFGLMGGQKAAIYESNSAPYCDGLGCTKPYLVYVTKTNRCVDCDAGEYHSLLFNGDHEMDEIELKILSTFRFTN